MPMVIAFGGRLPDSTAPERFVLEQVGASSRPRVCYALAGAEPSRPVAGQVQRDVQRLESLGCQVTKVQPSTLSPHALTKYDVVYVPSRNPDPARSMRSLYAALVGALDAGVVVAGMGGGAAVLFDRIVTTFNSRAMVVPGAGLLDGSFAPRFEEPKRHDSYLRRVGRGLLPPGYGVASGIGLVFSGQQPLQAVSAVSDAVAYRVERTPGSRAVTKPIETTFIG